jgi:hypothetical protein
MNRHRMTATAVAVVVCAVASSALAEDRPGQPPAAAKHEDGYMYSFDDDPLGATDFGSMSTTVREYSHVSRATLIRPRTAFVVELLKSVEVL